MAVGTSSGRVLDRVITARDPLLECGRAGGEVTERRMTLRRSRRFCRAARGSKRTAEEARASSGRLEPNHVDHGQRVDACSSVWAGVLAGERVVGRTTGSSTSSTIWKPMRGDDRMRVSASRVASPTPDTMRGCDTTSRTRRRGLPSMATRSPLPEPVRRRRACCSEHCPRHNSPMVEPAAVTPHRPPSGRRRVTTPRGQEEVAGEGWRRCATSER